MCWFKRISTIVCIVVVLFAFTAVGDDYDGVMQTHNIDVSAQMASEAIQDARLCAGTVSNLYGVWAAPDGGKWYFESNGMMGDAGRHRGMTYTLEDNQISFYGASGYEQYDLYFTTDYDQVFLFNADLSNCVLALNRLTQLMGGTNNLSGMTQDIPRGALDEIGVGPGVVFVAGWTYDPNATDRQSQYYVCIGGSYGVGEMFGPFDANLIRDDINISHGVGRYHGYAATVFTERSGYQDIYVYTTDYPSGQLVLMGHGSVSIPARSFAVRSVQAVEAHPNTLEDFMPLINRGIYLNTGYGDAGSIPAQQYYLFDFDRDGNNELIAYAIDDWYCYHWIIFDYQNGEFCILAQDEINKPGNAGHGLSIFDNCCVLESSYKGVVAYNAEWNTYVYYENGEANFLKSFYCERFKDHEDNEVEYDIEYIHEYTLNGVEISEEMYTGRVNAFDLDNQVLLLETGPISRGDFELKKGLQ